MSATVTTNQVKAFIMACAAVAEAIRDLGSVPSGELYARVMNHLDERTYNVIIERLIRSGLVARDGNHLLRWVGPKNGSES